MKGHSILLGAACWLLCIFNVPATVFYVDVNSTNPVPPYADWSTASTDIQSAIDAASDGDLILVADGIYATGGRMVYGSLTNRVVINKAVTVQSINGPSVTSIQGYQNITNSVGDDAVRCVYMTNNTMLIGFTLTKGATRDYEATTIEQTGGGAYCEASNVVLSNCVITANIALDSAGGIYQGTLNNCVLSANKVIGNYGGGAYASTLNNCMLTGNSSYYGGGAASCTINNSSLNGNNGTVGGAAINSVLNYCVIESNSSSNWGGGADNSTLNNCLIAMNTASALGGGTLSCTLTNCTLVGNSAPNGGGAAQGTLNNCILFDNYGSSGANYSTEGLPVISMNFCCTTPLPLNGVGNITNVPLFINPLANDFRLSSNSPCIDAGNNDYVVGTEDLDANPRIIEGIVDIGAFEYQSIIPLAVTIQPASQSVLADTTVNFGVRAIGQQPISYQWLFNGTNLVGATNNLLVLNNVLMNQAGNYSVTVSNALATEISSDAVLNVTALSIVAQPTDAVAWLGGSATFTVNVSGPAPFTFEWQCNNADIPESNTNMLVLTNLQANQFGSYSVTVSNLLGSLTSSNVTLTLSQVAVWGGANNESSLTKGLTNIIAIAGGSVYVPDCLALNNNGNVVIWPGSNYLSPTNIIAIAASGGASYPALVLKTDGTALSWNLLNSTITNLSGLTNIVAISPDLYGYLALMTNGIVTGSASIGLTNKMVAISEGGGHSLALKVNGTVVAWGNNTYGEASIPVGLSNVIAIAAGGYHSLALRANGTVVAWGRNIEGQTNVPIGLSNIVAIAAGGYHSLALKSNGTVVAWGLNYYGQTNVPAGLTNVMAIAAGQFHSMALIGNGPPVIQATLANSVVNSNVFSLSLPTQSGKAYVLQYKTSITDSNWTSLPLVAGTGGIVTLWDATATNSERFYRVQRW